jgi:hypothetical protein
MTTRGSWPNDILTFYDDVTHERVLAVSPVKFEEDFLGQSIDATIRWTLKDTAGGSEAVVDDGNGGICVLSLSATDEKQEAGIYAGDMRNWTLNQGLCFEARIKPAVLPTDQAEIYFGLAGDYVEGPIAEDDAGPAEHIFFCFDGSGVLKIFTDDTTDDNNGVTTGTTLTASDWAIVRIDCSTITDVKFYVNGSRVATGTTFDMSTVAALRLQPFFMVHKETGTGVGTLHIDFVRMWMKRE